MRVVVTLESGFAAGTVFSIKRRGIPVCIVDIETESGGNDVRVPISPRSMIPFGHFCSIIEQNSDECDHE